MCQVDRGEASSRRCPQGATLGAVAAAPAGDLGQMWTHSTFGGRRAPAKCSTRFSGTRTGPHTTPRYPKSRRRWRYAWARNAACSRFTPHDCFSLSTLGALNPLRFNRHYRPLLDRHAGIIENLRDDCLAPVSPAVAGLCDHRGGRGARCVLSNSKLPRSAPSKAVSTLALDTSTRRRGDDEARRHTPAQAAAGAHRQRRDARAALGGHRSHRSHGAPLCRRVP